MAIIKELSPGDTLKVYEDGVAAEFVVAQHNYEKDLNGKGKTMLMRTTLLKDAVYKALLPSGLRGSRE